MIQEQARDILQGMLAPMPLDSFLDEVLGKRSIKIEAGNNKSRLGLLGSDPGQTIANAYSHLSPKLGYHVVEAKGPPPEIKPLPDAKAFRAKIAEFHARGYTVRFPELRSLNPDLNRFVRALEFHFQQQVQAEAFWSLADARAPVHHDNYDLIAIQVKGCKRWFISTDPSPLPNDWKSIPAGPQTLGNHVPVEVQVGDLLYLPRGTPHCVEGLAESIHVSIGFVPLTLREALIACIDHLSDLDRPLREGVSKRTAAQIESSDFANIPAFVRDSIAALLAHCRSDAFIAQALQRRSSRIIGQLDKLEMPTVAAPLTVQTRVRHAPLAVAHLSGNDARIDFAYPGGHHYIQRGAEPGVVFIARTPEFRVGDIPGEMGDDVRIALVGKLIATGFLIVAGN